MPEEIGASDAETEHGLWVGSGLCPQESVVAEVSRYFRVVEVPGQDTHSRWGRAAARALPTMVGTGCRPSVTSPRVGGIGSTPKRAAATGAPGPCSVGSSASRRLDRTPCRERGNAGSRTRHALASRAVCDAPHAEGNSATRSTTPRQIRRCVRHFRSHPTTGTGERTDCSARSKWRRTSLGSRAMMFGRVSTLSLALFRCSCPCSATSHRGHARGLDPMAGLQIAHPLGRSIARAEGLGVRAPMPDATADGRHSGPVRERNRVGRSPSPTKGGHGSKRSGCGEDTFRKEKWREWRDSNP